MTQESRNDVSDVRLAEASWPKANYKLTQANQSQFSWNVLVSSGSVGMLAQVAGNDCVARLAQVHRFVGSL